MSWHKAKSRLWFASFVITGLSSASCEKQASNPPPPAATAAPALKADSPQARPQSVEVRPKVWRYTVRGEIVSLPKATGVDRDLSIRHETIDPFYSREGTKGVMNSMIMDFPALAKGVTLEGLNVGDAIVFDFEVDWETQDVWVVTRLARLVGAGQLHFEKAGQPGPEPGQK